MADPVFKLGKELEPGIVAPRGIVMPGDSVAPVTEGDCCCDGGGDPPGVCYIVVLACRCNNLRLAKVLPISSPGMNAAWPAADRRAGKVASIGGVCYRFVAATSVYPDGLDVLSFSDFDGVIYDSCSSSPCNAQQGCDCDVGFGWGLSNGIYPPGAGFECLRSQSVCGIERIDASLSQFVSYENLDFGNSPDTFKNTVQVNATGVIGGPNFELLEISGSGSSSGEWASREDEWDYSQSYSTDILTLDPTKASQIRNTFRDGLSRPSPLAELLYRPSLDGDSVARRSEAWPQSLGGLILCCCRTTDSGTSGASSFSLNANSTASMSASRYSVIASYDRTSTFKGEPASETKYRVQVSANLRYTLVGGIVIEDDRCDILTGDDPTPGPGGSDVGDPTDQGFALIDPRIEDNIRRQRGCEGCGG